MKKLLLGFMFICACATTYAYPSGIDVSKQQGAYIRANLRTLFAKKEACQNIGRNHVNFPEFMMDKDLIYQEHFLIL